MRAARPVQGESTIMSEAGNPTVPAQSSRLSRDDWLDAAFRAVVEGGFDNVRVLVLARNLGVTRGSFYWHFADHATLIESLLARWRERELASNQRVQGTNDPDPQKELELVLDAALAHAGVDLDISFC